MSRAIIVAGILLFTYPVVALSAQGRETADSSHACRKSVQDFYNWYMPRYKASLLKDVTPFTLALESKSTEFEETLAHLLWEDHEAQSKADEIVGLDFDPFLATNGEACSRYTVEKVTIHERGCLAEVHCTGKADLRLNPHVIKPELVLKNRKWVFVDFHYQEGGTLLEILKLNREGRKGDRSTAK